MIRWEQVTEWSKPDEIIADTQYGENLTIQEWLEKEKERIEDDGDMVAEIRENRAKTKIALFSKFIE